jgi:YegS/Rv2252/BmrU family lipid kinase
VTRALLITNPAAARTDARAVRAIRDTLKAGGWSVEVQATAQPGDARRFAVEARQDGVDAVVCYGGDGTTMQVAAGLVGSDIALGLVRGGTGNLLAGNLRLPRDPAAAARVILRARRFELDLGVVERDDAPHYFAVCSGAGFDARLMGDTPGPLKQRWKMGAYVVRALASLSQVRSTLHRVTVDGVAHERPAALVLIANCGELMPPFFRLRADIVPDDGWLDVVSLAADGTFQSLAAFWELLRGAWSGTSRPDGRLWFGRGRSVRVEVVGAAQQPVQLDGEVVGETPFEARLMPGALSVLVDPARLPQGNVSHD